MNLRKILHLLTLEQTKILLNDSKLIMERCGDVANTERKEQTENQKSRDNRCPRCRAKQDKLVDRIASVEGKGSIKGIFYLGFGNVDGSVNINTEAVNHCNVCGHEWKKFKTKTVTELAIIKVVLNYLSEIINNPEHNKKLSWKTKAIEVFKECHAEAIHNIQTKYSVGVRHPISIRKLRQHYDSVFDEK